MSAKQTSVTMIRKITFSYERDFDSPEQALAVASNDLAQRLQAGGNGGYALTVPNNGTESVIEVCEGDTCFRHAPVSAFRLDNEQHKAVLAILDEERAK
jgi:hypothetical protein